MQSSAVLYLLTVACRAFLPTLPVTDRAQILSNWFVVSVLWNAPLWIWRPTANKLPSIAVTLPPKSSQPSRKILPWSVRWVFQLVGWYRLRMRNALAVCCGLGSHIWGFASVLLAVGILPLGSSRQNQCWCASRRKFTLVWLGGNGAEIGRTIASFRARQRGWRMNNLQEYFFVT